MAEVELQVVGIQHRVTTATQNKISEYIEDNEGIYCELVREPENNHHDNAIKVTIAEAPFRGLHIGYLSRAVADVYAPVIDADEGEFIAPFLYALDAEAGTGMIRVRVRKGKTKRKR